VTDSSGLEMHKGVASIATTMSEMGRKLPLRLHPILRSSRFLSTQLMQVAFEESLIANAPDAIHPIISDDRFRQCVDSEDCARKSGQLFRVLCAAFKPDLFHQAARWLKS